MDRSRQCHKMSPRPAWRDHGQACICPFASMDSWSLETEPPTWFGDGLADTGTLAILPRYRHGRGRRVRYSTIKDDFESGIVAIRTETTQLKSDLGQHQSHVSFLVVTMIRFDLTYLLLALKAPNSKAVHFYISWLSWSAHCRFSWTLFVTTSLVLRSKLR